MCCRPAGSTRRGRMSTQAHNSRSGRQAAGLVARCPPWACTAPPWQRPRAASRRRSAAGRARPPAWQSRLRPWGERGGTVLLCWAAVCGSSGRGFTQGGTSEHRQVIRCRPDGARPAMELARALHTRKAPHYCLVYVCHPRRLLDLGCARPRPAVRYGRDSVPRGRRGHHNGQADALGRECWQHGGALSGRAPSTPCWLLATLQHCWPTSPLGPRRARTYVVGNGVVEQHAVLGHHGDGAAQRAQRDCRHVGAVDEHTPAGGVVEAQQQSDDGGLAAAGGAHQGQRLAPRQGEGDVAEDGCARGVAAAQGRRVFVTVGRAEDARGSGPKRKASCGWFSSAWHGACPCSLSVRLPCLSQGPAAAAGRCSPPCYHPAPF